jgi:hypothetical protein
MDVDFKAALADDGNIEVAGLSVMLSSVSKCLYKLRVKGWGYLLWCLCCVHPLLCVSLYVLNNQYCNVVN